MSVRYAQPGEVNYPVVDRWTGVHFGVGYVLGRLNAPWWVEIMLSVGWEIVEVPLKKRVPAIFPASTIDSPQNKIGDVVAMTLGWAVGKQP